MHKRLTLQISDIPSEEKTGGRTTETDFPLSSHPSQDVSSSGRVEETSMMVLTANNVSMPSKRRR